MPTDAAARPEEQPSTVVQRGARPTVVVVAAAIWWAVLALRTVVAVVDIALRGVGGLAEVPAFVLALVFVLGVSALFAWWAWRMWNGSRSARVCLAVGAGLAAVLLAVGTLTRPPGISALEPLALVVAAVLSFLPSARRWFPRTTRPERQRVVQARTIGWDPETGERIVERTDGAARS